MVLLTEVCLASSHEHEATLHISPPRFNMRRLDVECMSCVLSGRAPIPTVQKDAYNEPETTHAHLARCFEFSAVTLDGRRLDKRDDREQREQHLEPYKGHRDAVEHEVGSRHVDCHRTTVARRRSGALETEERGGVGAWGRRAWVRGRALTLQAQEVGVACERG